MPKKKFKDTKVGQFLLGKSGVLDSLAEVLPDKGLLGVVKNLIDRDETLPPPDKEMALKLLEQDIVEAQEVSKRWESDMSSDSWLSKNTRPLALVFLTLSSVFIMCVDSFHMQFDVDTAWVELLKTLLVTVYVAYFGSRGAEKITKINK